MQSIHAALRALLLGFLEAVDWPLLLAAAAAGPRIPPPQPMAPPPPPPERERTGSFSSYSHSHSYSRGGGSMVGGSGGSISRLGPSGSFSSSLPTAATAVGQGHGAINSSSIGVGGGMAGWSSSLGGAAATRPLYALLLEEAGAYDVQARAAAWRALGLLADPTQVGVCVIIAMVDWLAGWLAGWQAG